MSDRPGGRPTDPPAFFDTDTNEAFDAAFEHLTAHQRAILVLHHLHGYGVAEIAARLGVPAGTVKWRLHRARGALRAELARDD